MLEKNIKQGDVYLTGDEIIEKLCISKETLYKFFNQNKIRYVFRKMPRCGELCELIHFNLDDVRENTKKDCAPIRFKQHLGVVYRGNKDLVVS